MARLLRTNPTPVVLVLLALLSAVMGAAPGLVRCEHPDATAHVAAADHHADPLIDTCCDAQETDPAGDSEAPGDPHTPCDDTPLDLDPAPVPAVAQQFDLPDAPLLPVLAWVSVEPIAPVTSCFDGWTRGHPPGPGPRLLQTARFLI